MTLHYVAGILPSNNSQVHRQLLCIYDPYSIQFDTIQLTLKHCRQMINYIKLSRLKIIIRLAKLFYTVSLASLCCPCIWKQFSLPTFDIQSNCYRVAFRLKSEARFFQPNKFNVVYYASAMITPSTENVGARFI